MSFLHELKNISKNITVIYAEDDLILQDKTSLLLDNFIEKLFLCNDGVEALDSYKNYFTVHKRYVDIVITDIQMPNKDGIELIKDIFKINPNQEIIVISAHDDSKYLIELLNLGISHFILKPFNSKQFLNTLYECFIKINNKNDSNIQINNLKYSWDKTTKILKYGDQIIDLSKNEIEILNVLFLAPGQIFSNEMLFDIINNNENKELSIDSIKSTLKRVRKKLPKELIQNVYAQGYKINLV
jgi:DNA-binding response OmpR family regulator